MITSNKNLIEYIGLSKYLPTNLKMFKKTSSKFNIKIPKIKPAIKHLTKVIVDISIIEIKLIDTGKGKSLEGILLTGKKLLCYGFINYKLHYVSIDESENQNIKNFTVKKPFVKSVIIPDSIKKESDIMVSVYIDDITCILLNESEILAYTSFIISCE